MQYQVVLKCVDCDVKAKSWGVFGTDCPEMRADMVKYFERETRCIECQGSMKIQSIIFVPNDEKLDHSEFDIEQVKKQRDKFKKDWLKAIGEIREYKNRAEKCEYQQNKPGGMN